MYLYKCPHTHLPLLRIVRLGRHACSSQEPGPVVTEVSLPAHLLVSSSHFVERIRAEYMVLEVIFAVFFRCPEYCQRVTHLGPRPEM